MPVTPLLLHHFAQLLASYLAPLPADAPPEARALFVEIRGHGVTYLRAVLTQAERAELVESLHTFAELLEFGAVRGRSAADDGVVVQVPGHEMFIAGQIQTRDDSAAVKFTPNVRDIDLIDASKPHVFVPQLDSHRRTTPDRRGCLLCALALSSDIHAHGRALAAAAHTTLPARLTNDVVNGHATVLIGTGTKSDPRRYQCTKCKREFALMDAPGECNWRREPTTTSSGVLAMTSDQEGLIEISSSGQIVEENVPAGTAVTFIRQVTSGMVRVRLEDGREGVMQSSCFPGPRCFPETR